jgi:peroxiredoxin
MTKFLKVLQDPVRWAITVTAVALVGGLWIWASAVPVSATTGGKIPSPREGFPAPEFTLETLSDGQVSLSDFKGQVVVVNLWATWCPPCRAEMPALQSTYEQNRERGLVVLGVNITAQDSQAAVIEFVQDFNLTFPILLDTTGTVGRTYLMRAFPTTFFVDRGGVIRRVIVGGPISEITLQTTVEELLEEAP